MGFESFPSQEKQEGFDMEREVAAESGALRKLAKVPGAKKIMAVVSFLSVMAAAELSIPEKSEAGFAQIFRDTAGEAKAWSHGKVEENNEYQRLKEQDQRMWEREQYEKGQAQALKEIAENGRPTSRSWGSRKTDRKQDPHYQGYMGVVRRWEEDQGQKKEEIEGKKGRIRGRQRYLEENR